MAVMDERVTCPFCGEMHWLSEVRDCPKLKAKGNIPHETYDTADEDERLLDDDHDR